MKILASLMMVFNAMLITVYAQESLSAEKVLKDAKSTTALAHINNVAGAKYIWSQVKVQFKEFANGDNLYDSKLWTSQSLEASLQGLSYDDLGYYYVVATTPKNAEGVYYDVSLRVLYYRSSQNGVWNFRESGMESHDAFYRRGTEKIDQKQAAKAVEILRNYKGDGLDYGSTIYSICSGDDEMDFITITSIAKNTNIQDEQYTSQRASHYIVTGTVVRYRYKQSEINYYLENAKVALDIREEKDAKGNWLVTEVNLAPRTENTDFVQKTITEEEQLSRTRYKTLRMHGFDAVYQQESTYERDLFNGIDAYRNETRIRKIADAYANNQPQEGRKLLEQMIHPQQSNKEEIIRSVEDFFSEASTYLCELTYSKPSYAGSFGLSEKLNEKEKVLEFTTGITVHRRSCGSDKACMKRYKAAGISAELLKKNGAGINENPDPLTVEFKDNNWYITQPLTHSKFAFK